jgi:hypothetical protein
VAFRLCSVEANYCKLVGVTVILRNTVNITCSSDGSETRFVGWVPLRWVLKAGEMCHLEFLYLSDVFWATWNFD